MSIRRYHITRKGDFGREDALLLYSMEIYSAKRNANPTGLLAATGGLPILNFVAALLL
jgi:hypothetical protein